MSLKPNCPRHLERFTFHGFEEVAGGALDHTRHLLPTQPPGLLGKDFSKKKTWRENRLKVKFLGLIVNCPPKIGSKLNPTEGVKGVCKMCVGWVRWATKIWCSKSSKSWKLLINYQYWWFSIPCVLSCKTTDLILAQFDLVSWTGIMVEGKGDHDDMITMRRQWWL